MPNTTTGTYQLIKPEVGLDSGQWGGHLNTDLDSLDTEIGKPRLPFNSPTVGATTTCDLSLARIFVFTVSQATTLAFSNVPTSTWGVFVDLVVGNGSAFVLTFPGSVTWLQGFAPTLQAAGTDRIRLLTKDGGTTWFAVHFGKNLSVSGAAKVGTDATVNANVTAAHTGGLLSANITAVNSGAGSPANLMSYVLPAGTVAAASRGIRVKAWGQTANNANAKTVTVTWAGSTILTQALQVSVIDSWVLDCWIFEQNATNANTVSQGFASGTGAKAVNVGVGFGTTWANANTLQVACTQVAAGDVTQNGLVVEYITAG
jgi:hypothetical protein